MHVVYESFSAITSLNILGAVTGREVHLVLHLSANFHCRRVDVSFQNNSFIYCCIRTVVSKGTRQGSSWVLVPV